MSGIKDLSDDQREGKMMKAAYFTGNNNIVIKDVPKPVLKDGEVLVKVKACGLCGSEKKQLKRGTDCIPGHEISGVVAETNPGSNIRVGTRVALYLPYYCGECFYCQQGKTNACQNRAGLIGHSMDGGYAEYVAVRENVLIPLDDALSYEQGVLLLDTIGTTHHGLRLGNAEANDIALVIGCGPIGLGTVFGLRNMGVRRVYAADIAPKRLEFAEKLGAIPIDVREKDLVQIMKVELKEGVPLVVDCVGGPQTIGQAVRIVAAGGTVILIGEYWDKWEVVPHGEFMLKDWNLVRSWYFPLTEVAENMNILKHNTVASKLLVSHTFPLEELSRAFDLFFSGETAKVIIKME